MRKLLFALLFMVPACIEVPPIVIAPAPPAPPVAEAPAPKPKATIAFQVVNECDGQPITTAFVNITDGPTKQVNDDGYVALELEAGGAVYLVVFEDPGYQSQARKYQLDGNRQFAVRMMPTAGCPRPEPPKPVDSAPGVPTPPVVTAPPVVVSPLEESAGWSDEQWRAYLIPLLKRTGELVNDASMKVARPEINARGADFQNGWRGDLRPRVFLPVTGCPPATRADVPPCSYNRTVDLGQYGEPWQWIKR